MGIWLADLYASYARVYNHVIAVYSEKQDPALRYCLQEP